MAETNSSNSLSQLGTHIRFPNFHHYPRRMLRFTLAAGMSGLGIAAIFAFTSGLSLLTSVAIVAASILMPITVDALLGFFSINPSRSNPPAQTSGTMTLSQEAQNAISRQPSSTPAPTSSVNASAQTTAVSTTSATILQTSSSASSIPETLIPSKITSSTATIITALNPNETFITPIAQPPILSSASIAAVDTLSAPRALNQNSLLTPITSFALKKLNPTKVSTDNPFQTFNRKDPDNPLTNISSQSTGQSRRR